MSHEPTDAEPRVTPRDRERAERFYRDWRAGSIPGLAAEFAAVRYAEQARVFEATREAAAKLVRTAPHDGREWNAIRAERDQERIRGLTLADIEQPSKTKEGT